MSTGRAITGIALGGFTALGLINAVRLALHKPDAAQILKAAPVLVINPIGTGIGSAVLLAADRPSSLAVVGGLFAAAIPAAMLHFQLNKTPRDIASIATPTISSQPVAQTVTLSDGSSVTVKADDPQELATKVARVEGLDAMGAPRSAIEQEVA